MRSFDKVARNMLERCIDGQKRERRIDVGESQHDRKWAVKKELNGMTRQVYILQEHIQDSVGAENRFPRVGPYQVADPERNDHHLVQQILSRTRIKRQKIRKRISKN